MVQFLYACQKIYTYCSHHHGYDRIYHYRISQAHRLSARNCHVRKMGLPFVVYVSYRSLEYHMRIRALPKKNFILLGYCPYAASHYCNHFERACRAITYSIFACMPAAIFSCICDLYR